MVENVGVRGQPQTLTTNQVSVDWQIGGEDLVKGTDDVEADGGRLRSRSAEEVVFSEYNAAATVLKAYGFGSMSVDHQDLRATTRHGFEGTRKRVIKGTTSCIIVGIVTFSFLMALIVLSFLPHLNHFVLR